jgi:hypothetical protein
MIEAGAIAQIEASHIASTTKRFVIEFRPVKKSLLLLPKDEGFPNA